MYIKKIYLQNKFTVFFLKLFNTLLLWLEALLSLIKFKINKMQKQLLSRKETATLLSISLPTLAKYTREGILKARVLGNIIRYDYEEILKSFNVN